MNGNPPTTPLPDPPLLLITDRHEARYPLAQVVGKALEGGVRWILLREKDLSAEDYGPLLVEIQALAAEHDVTLAISGRIALAAEHGLRAVHLPSADAGLTRRDLSEARRVDARLPTEAECQPSIEAIARARTALGRGALIGVSCHGLHDLRIVAAAGADYATLSPIYPTLSKPVYGPLQGIPGLRRATEGIDDLPVLALGGLRADRVAVCRKAGAAGVAVVGAIMGALHPDRAAASIIGAWRDATGGSTADSKAATGDST